MEKINWKIALEVLGIIGALATILALFLGPMLYLGNKIDNFKDTMFQEMKDFHGRLCAIEERNKK